MYLATWLKAWNDGIECFNQGRWWHAHEGWEKDWTRLPSTHKDHLQALIMGCGVLIHLAGDRRDPARRLCLRALELFAASGAHVLRLAPPYVAVPGFEEFLKDIRAGFETGDLQPEAVLKNAVKLKAHLETSNHAVS